MKRINLINLRCKKSKFNTYCEYFKKNFYGGKFIRLVDIIDENDNITVPGLIIKDLETGEDTLEPVTEPVTEPATEDTKNTNNITISYTKPTGTGTGLKSIYIDAEYPVTSDVLIQASTDGGDTWSDFAVIPNGSITPQNAIYHGIGCIYRLNPSTIEDTTYIYNVIIIEN